MLVALVPLAHADEAVRGGAMAPTLTGYVVTFSHEFAVQLVAGDVLDVTLEWDNPEADLDVRVVAPGGSCTVLPEPDVECQAARTPRAGLPTCPSTPTMPFLARETRETMRHVAAVTGGHRISVQGAWVAPHQWADYELRVSRNGHAPELGPRETINNIHGADIVGCHAAVSP